ncbi:MAG: transcriptional regulator [Desulfuromonas sp.]|nr:MAG: transcriptional regulator [Desulfuromonas sp.]
MKQIQAYIKKHKLNEVIRSLRKAQMVSGLSVMDRHGFGLGWSEADESEQDMLAGVKLEVFCRDEVVDEVVALIEKASRTGLKGDGKIYVSNIKQAVRISTGERGEGVV